MAAWAAWALAASLAAGGGDGAAPTLRLRCDGKTNILEAHNSVHFLASGGVSTYKSFGHRRDDERVLFEMKDGAARLHMPSSLVPAVHGGDEDGWFTLTDLHVTDDVITGRFRLNVINKPSVRIDRVNGDIELGGQQPFRGQCESTAGQERKF